MIALIVSWIACIVLSCIAIAIKEMYEPTSKVKNAFMNGFMVMTLGIQLTAIYLTAEKSSLLTMIAVMLFDYYWFVFAPFHPNGDAAGNGMARAFRPVINITVTLVLGVVSFLLIKFLTPNGWSLGLYTVLTVATLIGLYNIAENSKSFISGGSFYRTAREAHMTEDDFRKTLFRESMLENNDLWKAKELDASPQDLEFWDAYLCNDIAAKTYGKLHCLLLEGHFEFPERCVDFHFKRFGYGCLESVKNADLDYREEFMPQAITLAWYDTSDGNTYKIQENLPKELEHYFDDKERFHLDDVEFCIMPRGRVLMYHNAFQKIHNILIEYPLLGKVTDEYNQVISDYLQEKRIDVKKYRNEFTPSLDTIDNYLKRYDYKVSFASEDNKFNITKTICSFFNGEKVLSDGEWKANIHPARIKDVFLRFENADGRYSAFVYFSEEEILRCFEEAFTGANSSEIGEFIITVGAGQSAFKFELKLGDKAYSLNETEVRLYINDRDDGGKLVFKNYKGNHRNLLYGLAIKASK
ncbi:MAG: hypothetical protein MJ211_11910 [Bacteroidales bacterium]|nr:hypothetical protein [Bacteroidales bacterium]